MEGLGRPAGSGSLITGGLRRGYLCPDRLNPLEVYKGIFDGAVGTKRRTWMTIRDTLVLLCIAIGITPAFKMRFWNIGAEGQVLIGGRHIRGMMIYLGNSLLPWFCFR